MAAAISAFWDVTARFLVLPLLTYRNYSNLLKCNRILRRGRVIWPHACRDSRRRSAAFTRQQANSPIAPYKLQTFISAPYSWKKTEYIIYDVPQLVYDLDQSDFVCDVCRVQQQHLKKNLKYQTSKDDGAQLYQEEGKRDVIYIYNIYIYTTRAAGT